MEEIWIARCTRRVLVGGVLSRLLMGVLVMDAANGVVINSSVHYRSAGNKKGCHSCSVINRQKIFFISLINR